MEYIINKQLLRHLENHALLSDHQYGFRPARSTGDLLAYLSEKWTRSLEQFDEAIAISIDIRNAF